MKIFKKFLTILFIILITTNSILFTFLVKKKITINELKSKNTDLLESINRNKRILASLSSININALNDEFFELKSIHDIWYEAILDIDNSQSEITDLLFDIQSKISDFSDRAKKLEITLSSRFNQGINAYLQDIKNMKNRNYAKVLETLHCFNFLIESLLYAKPNMLHALDKHPDDSFYITFQGTTTAFKKFINAINESPIPLFIEKITVSRSNKSLSKSSIYPNSWDIISKSSFSDFTIVLKYIYMNI